MTGLTLAATAAVGTVPAEAATSCHVAFKTYEPIKQGSTGAQAKAMECGIGHVALYAGNGRVIHAPHPGKSVSYIKMKYMPYMGARRPG